MNIRQSTIPLFIVAAPLLVSFVLPVVGRWRRAWVFPLAITALTISFGTSILTTREVLTSGPVQYFMGGWMPPWGIEFHIDHLGVLMLLLLSFITLLVAIYSKQSILKEVPDREAPFYSVYLLLAVSYTNLTLPTIYSV